MFRRGKMGGRNRPKPSDKGSSSRNSLSKRKIGNRDSPSDKRKKKNRRFPSEEALQLSDQLKKLSREKKLDEALAVFWDKSNDTIRDGHHACIMVDATARCGNIAEGELLLERIANQGIFISVETKTALLKGICHSGEIRKAHELFMSMCASKVKSNYPNVRTLNTLLRGCLWCAATSTNGTLVGGVVTAEIAWAKYKSLRVKDERHSAFDISSYEYTITLLCQALRVKDAITRISEMKQFFGVSKEKKELASSDDQSLTEGLAVAYCALARAYTVLKKSQEAIAACKTSLDFAKVSKEALQRGSSFSRKRGWKESDGREDCRRSESNVIYRNHRLSEIETESKTLMTINTTERNVEDISRELARRLITRLISLSGGGTTALRNDSGENPKNIVGGNNDTSKEVQRDLLNSLYFSYGLHPIVRSLGIPIDKELQILRKKDCNRILGGVGLQGGVLKSDGCLDLHRIFSAGIGVSKPEKRRKGKHRRVEVELGAGFGEWIVQKAIQDPSTDFIAVELRSDRVAQIFARTAVLSTVDPVNNLCVVGAESGNLLCNHLSDQSVDTIYVNHPEPPTQTFGAESENLISISQGGPEPAHMLNSDVIIAAGKTLKRVASSRFVVVTDNYWYGRLICATIEKVMLQNSCLFRAVDLASVNNNQCFTEVQPNAEGSVRSVLMFKGKPDEAIGYPSGSTGVGASYFDRLWRAGGGRHAEIHERYIIVMSPSCQ